MAGTTLPDRSANSLALLLQRWGEQRVLQAGAAVILGSTLASLLLVQPAIMALPLLLIGLALWVYDFRPFAYLLWLATPLSLEIAVGDALSTDLPTEPLMLVLAGAFLVWIVLRRKQVPWERFKHPVTTVLGLHLGWLLVSTLFSVDHLVSAKWMAAKLWYVLAFFGITIIMVRKARDFRGLFWCLFVPSLFTAIWTLSRHASRNFSFADVNFSMEPFFRNHVNYAVFLALVTPFVWLAVSWYPRWSWPRMLLLLSRWVFPLAVYFSYTRSAWISLVVGLVAYVLLRQNRLREGALVGLLVLLGTCGWLLHNNRYLDFAPDFSKTIYHDDFADHMAATASLEDVSSAERIYRWVAGWYMFLDKPVTGFGPGNFYPHYQNYTVSSFYTYISRNEERSTVHNYYLLTLLETGLIGCVLFFVLVYTALFRVQRAFNRAVDRETRGLALAVGVSLVTILVNLFFSDLVEADKIGTMFFALLALVVVLDRQPT
ncbi:MAG: hypothetical protein GC205_01275 [Bacteroidetes bacterium]|nr:hypothetical protein [Bacteroidota bacterium]